MTPSPQRRLTVSVAEKSTAATYLAQTRDGLVAAVQGLSDKQWRFRTSPDRWSIAGVVEHVAMVEERVHRVISTLDQAPEAESGRDELETDRLILAQIPARTSRVEAPPHVQPCGECEPDEALIRFLEARERTRELLESNGSLRGRIRPHPVFGPWDGYQWILGAGAHSARHTNQILETKSHAGFPA
jgi:hypothetical protein